MNKSCFKSGFTLIELLVVVLIIGILAAIALPQYNKAVMKSKLASLKPVARAVKNAQEIYYEAQGYYAPANQLEDLDVQIPTDAVVEVGEDKDHAYVRVRKADLNVNYVMYLAHSTNFSNNIYCAALTSDPLAGDVCVADGGTNSGNDGDYTMYLLSGSGVGSFGPSYANVIDGQRLDIWGSDGELYANSLFDNGAYADCWGEQTCQNSMFDHNSTCLADIASACDGSSFDHGSKCEGGAGMCNDTTFTNGSKCISHGPNSCNGEYDDTSCCQGSDCPSTAPRC